MAAIKPDAVFAVEGAPDWQVLTDDAVWVTSAPKNTVHRLDVKTNQVAAVITVGKKPCSGLAAGFGQHLGAELRRQDALAHRHQDESGGGDASVRASR